MAVTVRAFRACAWHAVHLVFQDSVFASERVLPCARALAVLATGLSPYEPQRPYVRARASVRGSSSRRNARRSRGSAFAFPRS